MPTDSAKLIMIFDFRGGLKIKKIAYFMTPGNF